MPSRVSTSVSEAADEMPARVSTRRESESPPDIDQPPSPDVPVAFTSSLNVTSMVVSEVALADVMVGFCPSARFCETVAEPSALPDASATAAASIETEPVAPVPTGLAVENVTVCLSVEPLARPETAAAAPSTVADR